MGEGSVSFGLQTRGGSSLDLLVDIEVAIVSTLNRNGTVKSITAEVTNPRLREGTIRTVLFHSPRGYTYDMYTVR